MFDESINPFEDTGAGDESTPTTGGDSVFTEDPKEDSAVETPKEDLRDAEKPVAEPEAEGTKEVSPEADSKEVSDEDRKKSEEEAEKRLADPNSPKWFKNYAENVYKPNLAKLNQELQAFDPIKSYGDLDKVKTDLEIFKGLDAIAPNPQTGLPEKTVKPFVDGFMKTRGIETGVQVFVEMGKVQVPKTGRTLFDELLKANEINPDRLADIREFAKNGYQLNGGYPPPEADDLELIPDHLHATFAALSPDERLELFALNEETRNRTLENEKYRSDNEARDRHGEAQRIEREQAEKVQQQQRFQQNWEKRHLEDAKESGERLITSFTESLVKDAGFEDYEALGMANLVTAAIGGTDAAAEKAKALLENQGVKLDPKLGELIRDLYDAEKGETRTLAFYNLPENQQSQVERDATAKKVRDLESQIIAKANPIIAHFAERRGKAVKARIETRNSIIDDTQKAKTGINANEGRIDPTGSLGSSGLTDAQREAVIANPFG